MTVTVVLPEEAVSSTGPTVFPGIPGVFVPGEPQEIDDEVAASEDFANSLLEVVKSKTAKPKDQGADE